jgi:hypothetical protein
MRTKTLNKKTGSLALAVLLIPTAAAQTETSEVEISVLLDGQDYDVTTDDTVAQCKSGIERDLVGRMVAGASGGEENQLTKTTGG